MSRKGREGSTPSLDTKDVMEDLSAEEKLALAIKTLEKIADFTHADCCDSKCVPVHECGCYDMDETSLAYECLARLGLRRSLFEDEDCDNNE